MNEPSLSPPTSPRRKKKRTGPYTPRLTRPAAAPPPRYAPSFQPTDASSTGTPSQPLTTLHLLQAILRQEPFSSTSIPLILDTGASVSVSNDRADFVGPIHQVQNTTLQGIASGLPIHGVGTVTYTISTSAGTPLEVTIPNVLFVPNCPGRLICPRQLLLSLPQPCHFNGTSEAMTFHIPNHTIVVPYANGSRLPILYTCASTQAYMTFCSTHDLPSASTPANLTPAQHLKLRWHQRLNHANMDQVTAWMRAGTIQVPPEVINCPNPTCAACLFGRAKRRPHTQQTNPIAANHTAPGDGISADQFEAGSPGIVPTSKGLPTKMTYKFCNFWVDNYSKLIFVTMHQSKDARELLQSKRDFEVFCRQHGVTIKTLRADNGIYAANSFQTSCSTSGQSLTFCGVGSHWQNGLAERAIGMIQATARTILLHAMALWPTAVDETFWPFAIRHSVHLHNISCRKGQEKSPWELFTGAASSKHINDSRIFGCPAFVLHKTMQDNPGSTKTWTERCWQGIYVGTSSQHASTVALVYNPSTRHVTPQYHVTFDESFSTVCLRDPTALEARLEQLVNSKATWHYSDIYDDPDMYFFQSSGPTTTPAPVANLVNPMTHSTHPNRRPLYKPVPCSDSFRHWREKHHIAAEVYHCPAAPTTAPSTHPDGSRPDAPTLVNPPPSTPSGAPFTTTVIQQPCGAPSPAPATLLDQDAHSDPAARGHHTHTLAPDQSHTYLAPLPISEGDIPASEGATQAFPPPPHPCDNDTLTQSAMLRAPDRDSFIQAQEPEITGLEQQGVFTYHPIAELPARVRLLNAIWSYKRKRSPTGVLLKYKSRLCTDGSQQRQGIDYTATYAPVVAWSTVRLILALSSIRGLQSRQVDFTQAFTQSPIDTDVYMRIPQGWFAHQGHLRQHPDPTHRDASHFIRLAKTLYGVKQAARQWYAYIHQGLLALGFRCSCIDPCLFIRKDCIILLYVDDCLLFGTSTAVIDDIIANLSRNYIIGEQGSVQDFLGIRISSDATGTITFHQEGLITSILQDLHLLNGVPKFTPAVHVLHPDETGSPREELWNYRSIVGKLNFLSQMTRPDISMAVHNCARFSARPTSLHEQAVKRIGRYLLHTRNHGLIYRPQPSGSLDMYVDADFAGTWHKEYAHLRSSCLSRTGYVITYNGCPIHWGSRLQSEIALSTTEAEYIALSTATRELLPLRRILLELSSASPMATTTPLPPSTIYEDNASCITLAHRETQLRPRTKHIALKFHHFRDHVLAGTLRITKVPTTTNWADIFTKPLTQYVHERLRFLMMGW